MREGERLAGLTGFELWWWGGDRTFQRQMMAYAGRMEIAVPAGLGNHSVITELPRKSLGFNIYIHGLKVHVATVS